jgi:hypothetical protein|tara:strand:+ start:1104 stop:1436 length:333 start_codon:yes stop_codon:yes gene_type:complete
MSEVTIIDEDSIPHAPSSKFLSKEEMKNINPDWIWNRNSFIFKYGKPMIVEHNVAQALIKKYDTVKFENQPDDLINMKYQALKKLAVKNGIPWSDTFVSKEELVNMINKI